MAMKSVTLPPDLINKCEDYAAQVVNHFRDGEHPHTMPWSRDLMSDDELRAWLANRKQAGRSINIETCELAYWAALDTDPYGIREMLGDEPYPQLGTNRFVRSADSNGWVHEGDLPPDKGRAMYDRIARQAHARRNQFERKNAGPGDVS